MLSTIPRFKELVLKRSFTIRRIREELQLTEEVSDVEIIKQVREVLNGERS